ncbi:MAG: DUF1697 domain-containing protein [Patescibacteria group bacterium]
MTTYVALLRGIGPTNPNMHGSKLKWAFEELGLKEVIPVISSGNVIFKSSSKNSRALGTKIEKALPKLLGFKSSTIVRSQEELEHVAEVSPFKSRKENKKEYLVVTFLKNQAVKDGAIFTTIDMSKSRTPEFMRSIEKKYGKEITTRTWKTVNRIIQKMRPSY